MMYVLSPDDVASIFSLPFFVSYWPLIFGTVVMSVSVIAGYIRLTFILGVLVAALQAWHSGLFT
jgi:hypothetical protein